MKLETIKKKIIGKKILITGNTGFVGSWLSIALHFLGANVLGYSLKKRDKKFLSNTNLFKNNIRTIFGEIIEINKSKNEIKKFKPNIAIHLASQPLVLESYKNTRKTFLTNIMGTIDFLETLKDIKTIKKIIIFTSDKVYQNLNGKVLNENSPLGGLDPYSASKSCQDIISSSYKSSILNKNIEVTIVRAGNIIGGGDWNKFRLVPDIFKSIHNKNNLIVRKPNAIRPWQHVLEILNAFILIIISKTVKQNNKPQVFNIAPELKSNVKVIEIINHIKDLNKNKKFKIKINKSSLFETSILKLSSIRAKKDINFTTKINLKKSIKLTSDWYKNFYENKNMFSYTIDQIESYFRLH